MASMPRRSAAGAWRKVSSSRCSAGTCERRHALASTVRRRGGRARIGLYSQGSAVACATGRGIFQGAAVPNGALDPAKPKGLCVRGVCELSMPLCL